QRGNTGRNRERDSVHTQDFAIKLGDVFEYDPIIHPRTTSRARIRAFSIATETMHTKMSTPAMAALGMYCSCHLNSGAPSKRCHNTDMMTGRLSRDPHLVRKIALTMPPTPAGTNIAAKMSPVATTLHLTHEESART